MTMKGGDETFCFELLPPSLSALAGLILSLGEGLEGTRPYQHLTTGIKS